MPRGIPASGKRAKGAGRKPLGPANLAPTTVWLSDADLAYLRALRPDGNVSAAVRDVVARDRELREKE